MFFCLECAVIAVRQSSRGRGILLVFMLCFLKDPVPQLQVQVRRWCYHDCAQNQSRRNIQVRNRVRLRREINRLLKIMDRRLRLACILPQSFSTFLTSTLSIRPTTMIVLRRSVAQSPDWEFSAMLVSTSKP